MSDRTKIQWCDATWNPWIGCTKVSAGCANCYAEHATPTRVFAVEWGPDKPRHPTSISLSRTPYGWNKNPWVCEVCEEAWPMRAWHPDCGGTPEMMHRRRVFTLSLGDWLDPEVPITWLSRMLQAVWECQNIDFLLCTKRPHWWERRLEAVLNQFDMDSDMFNFCFGWLTGQCVPQNVWVIASAENQDMADKRIPELLKIPAVVRGVSCEPLLGPIDLAQSVGQAVFIRNERDEARRIDWVIVGGESGKNARPCNIEWIRSVKDQCQAAGVPCFVKQLGSYPIHSKSAIDLRHKKGGDSAEWPEELRVRQFPKAPR